MGNRKAALFLLSIFCLLFVSIPEFEVVKAESKIIIVPDDYSAMSWAVGNASEGDTIYVKSGIYQEHIAVDKSISLVGEDWETTIIDGNNSGQVVNITKCDTVNITGFTIRNSGRLGEGNSAGVGLWKANYCNISGNKVTNSAYGIFVITSHNNIISRNIIEMNKGSGIRIDGWGQSNFNSLCGNELVDNGIGIDITSGNNNSVYENNLANNGWEIHLDDSHNNSIFRNNITHVGEHGIIFTWAQNNSFFHNNFDLQIVDRGWLYPPWIPNSSISIWDNGIDGNFWSAYNGTDNDGDGIGDTPYIINENNQDNHPLIEPHIIPEFPLWTILPLLLASTLTVIIYRKKLHRIQTQQSY
jgi:nitrous oxidase accessory protein